LNLVTGVSLIPIRPATDTHVREQVSKQGCLHNFIAGPENSLVGIVYRALLIDANIEPSINPVVFFGPTGVGKSHLALGLAAAWSQRFPSAASLITSGRDWARSYADAQRRDALVAWRDNLRQLRLLVVEDVSHLHKRTAAQRELATLLDDLQALDVPCIFTGRANPLAISELTSGFASRLTAGLSIPLHHPETSTREIMIRELAQRQQCTFAGDAAKLLVQSGGETFVHLRRAVLLCTLATKSYGRQIRCADVRKILSDNRHISKLTINTISSAVARYFGLTNKQLISTSRRKAVTRARGVAIYLCRELTATSLKDIGQFFGKRDHTTVLHAYRKTKLRLHTDSDVQTAVDDLKNLFQSHRVIVD
jgi:chromosomal replication initiator protein